MYPERKISMDYKIRRAVESEYSDLIDFASMVFYVNFPYRLPKLSLQPLVENAVLHGIRQIGSGTLTITGEKEGGMLHFVVEDDGAGMEEEALARLREVLDCGNNAHPDHSYGISSVARRLYLVFNNNYRMTVDSELGMGTRVELWIPALREEQINATLAHRMI